MIDIHPKLHGIIDYLTGLLFILLPIVFNWQIFERHSLVFEISGIVIIIYSLLTKYDLGITNTLSIQKHLVLDTCMGLFIISSPFIFGFYKESYTYHLIAGLGLILLVGFSTTISPATNPGDYFSQTDKRYY